MPGVLVGSVVLAGLMITLAITVGTGRPGPAWALVVLSAGWLVADHALEGPVLFVYSSTHGLTLADLLSALGAAVGFGALLRAAWRPAPAGGRIWRVLTVVGSVWAVLALGVLFAVTLD